jgi:hypothetical protein
MKINTQSLLASCMMVTLFAACSRPVAYFQPTHREQFATAPAKIESVTSTEVATPVVAETPAVAAAPTEQVAQSAATLDQVDALVRNDSKLAADKSVQKRLTKVRSLLAETSARAAATPAVTAAPKKMNLIERLVLKKMNKKISKQLAPNNPNKPMVNRGLLVGGIILLLVGLLLAILASGTGSTIGVIILLLGAISLVLGLLAS